MPANGEFQVGGITQANAETIRELLAGWVEQANRDATKARFELERQQADERIGGGGENGGPTMRL